MKLPLFLCLSIPAWAHHGQDFLVTLDATSLESGEFRTFFGGEFTSYAESNESSTTQSLIVGLPRQFSFASIFRYADEGSGSWDSFSVTPMLQWVAPKFAADGPFSKLQFAAAFGWEIPIEQSDHRHDDHGAIPPMDCSALIGIPPLFQACQLANQNAASHSHGDGGHAHTGIHRHGESHGFLRFITEFQPTPRDRFVFNSIAVFPRHDSPQWGYAAAYRHKFSSKLALGVEAIGDFDQDGEHLVYLTGTSYVGQHFSVTLGAATGLTESSPDFTIQTLISWRF